MGAGLKLQIINAGSGHIAAGMAPRGHSRYYVNPFYQLAAEQTVIPIDMPRHQNLNLRRFRFIYMLGFSLHHSPPF